MAPITIRSATAEDCEAVTAIWHSCGLVTSYNDPRADFHRALPSSAASSSDILIAFSTKVMGTAMVGFDGHRGWIYYLACDPSAQGQGIGKVLVEAAEAWLKARGVPKVQLLIRQSNEDNVVPFYEKLGFEKAPTTVMGKWL